MQLGGIPGIAQPVAKLEEVHIAGREVKSGHDPAAAEGVGVCVEEHGC